MKTRTTLRTLTFDYGPMVTTPTGFVLVALVMLMQAESWHWLVWVVVPCALVWCTYSAYQTWVSHRYRTRADLPEWQEALNRSLRERGVVIRPENWGD